MTKKPDDAQADAERRAFNAMNARPPAKAALGLGAIELRDLFAMVAMTINGADWQNGNEDTIAKSAYTLAGAMIKTRDE